MTKRIFAMLLAVVMVMGLLPMSVFAGTADDRTKYETLSEHDSAKHICEHCVAADENTTTPPTWTPWGDNGETTLPTAAGHYYLTKDLSVTKVDITSGHVVLCLNGKTVTAAGTEANAADRFYYLRDDGSVTITDCTAHTATENGEEVYKAGKLTGATSSAIMFHNATGTTGALNIYDGIITGNSRASSGGAIVAQGKGTVSIYGGQIVDNHATNGSGGAIYLNSSSNTLYVENALIADNTASSSSGAIYSGNAAVTIKDSELTGNSAPSAGAIVMKGAALTLENTKITGNNTTKGDYGAIHPYNSGGTATVTVKGETVITGNYYGDPANGVERNLYLRNHWYTVVPSGLTGSAKIGLSAEAARINDTTGKAPITGALNGADVKAYFVSDSADYVPIIQNDKLILASADQYGHVHTLCNDGACTDGHGDIAFVKWTDGTSLPTSGNYYLATDVTLSAAVGMTGTELNLCLNGHNVYVKEGAGVRHFYPAEGAKLSITDCSATPGALMNGESASIMTNKDAKNMEVNLFNIGLKNNKRSSAGGAIAAQGGATFNLVNVEISGNEAAGSAGVVYAQNTAVINITGGSIHDNHAVGNGGVFNLTSGSNSLTVKGTTFKNNTTDKNGAVVYCEKTSAISFEDCVFTENKAESGEGGVAYLKTAKTTFKNCELTGNTGKNGSTLVVFGGSCLLDGTKIQNNHAISGYGAVHINRSGDVTVTVQGQTVISDNTTGTANTIQNVYMRNSASYLTVGTLTEGAKVCVTMEPLRLNANLLNISANDVTEEQAGFIYSDNADYMVKVVDGKARLTTGHSHKVCVGSACTETHSDLEWRKWEKTDSLPTSGNYYLTADVQLTEVCFVGGKLNLCLNGYTITAPANSRLFSAENGGVLSITDCTGTGTITGGSKTYGGAVAVQQGGTFNLYGGKISGNTALTEEGGAVYVKGGNDSAPKGGIFHMYGGEISGNTARQGAAVRLTNPTTGKENAVFNMYGGKIVNNEATTNGSAIYAGASTVNLYGGEISGNTAGANGTIYVSAGTKLTIADSKITGNTAGNGAGLYVAAAESSVTLSGNAYIIGNTAGGKANNVFLSGESLIAVGPLKATAKIGLGAAVGSRAVSATVDTDYTANFSSDSVYKKLIYKDKALYLEASTEHQHCVCMAGAAGCDHSTQVWQAWESNASLPTDDGYYYLTEDVVLASQANISGKTKLCLNGHSVSMTEGAENVRVLKLLEGAELSLTDCQGTGKITGGNASWGGGVNINRGAVMNLYGGIITGNTSLDEDGGQGAGVYVQATKDGVEAGIFNMYGGEISGNEAVWGGAVYGAQASTINIYGGTISGNTATTYGGGIYATGSATSVSGSTVKGNTASGGGAIYVTGAGSKLNISDATFSNNTVSGYAGGAILAQSNGTQITVQNSTFSGNKAQAGGALFASTNTILNVEDTLFSGNTANQGAAIYTLRSTAKLDKVTMEKNTVTKHGTLFICAGEVTMDGVRIKNNKGGSGTGFTTAATAATVDGEKVTLYPTVTMISGTISGNTNSTGSGGAALLQGKTVFTMKGGSVSGNSAKWCGGVYASTNSTFNMQGGSITGNYSDSNGGGVYALRSTLNLSGGSISGNNAKGSGGGVMLSGAKLYLSGTYITGNKSLTGTGGGGICTGSARVSGVLYEPYIKMTGGSISNNEGRHGGAVLLQGSSNTVFDISGGSIKDNKSTNEGGAFYISTKTTINMTGGTVAGNATEGRGGAVYHNNSKGNYTGGEIYGNSSKGSGGGFLINGSNCQIVMKDMKLYDHSGSAGGTICNQGRGMLTMENCEIYDSVSASNGGAIYISNNTPATFLNCNFYDCSAKNAGGVWVGINSEVLMDSVTIENNKAEGDGGGLLSRDYLLTIKNSKIIGNSAGLTGGGISTYKYALQGVTYVKAEGRRGTVIENCEIRNNESKTQGGGAYFVLGCLVSVTDTVITGNTAAQEGGALWAKCDLTMRDLEVNGNSSGGAGYAVWLDSAEYDGKSYYTGIVKMSGDMIVENNQGGDMYLAPTSTVVVEDAGLGENTKIQVTLDSGVLTNRIFGAYHYEGGDQVYTVTYGDRSLTEPEYDPNLASAQQKEAAKGITGDVLLYAGVGVFALAIAAVVVLLLLKKKKKNTAEAAKD